MSHRLIGQEQFSFAQQQRTSSSLDEIARLIEREPISRLLNALYSAMKREPLGRRQRCSRPCYSRCGMIYLT